MSIKSISYSILFITLLIFPQISKAGFIPSECLDDKAEKCGLESFTRLFVFLYYFSLKYLGALALLLFVVGGIMWLTSGGNQERVAKGRKILVGTTVGIMIVLGSFVIVTQLQEYIGTNTKFQINKGVKTNNNDIKCKIEGGECMECKNDAGEKADCMKDGKNANCKEFKAGLCSGDNSNMCCIDKK